MEAWMLQHLHRERGTVLLAGCDVAAEMETAQDAVLAIEFSPRQYRLGLFRHKRCQDHAQLIAQHGMAAGIGVECRSFAVTGAGLDLRIANPRPRPMVVLLGQG